MGASSGAYEIDTSNFTREVKVTTIFHCRITHGAFPSLCVGDNHGIV